jgi:outer membrane protein assembly factor BamB
MEPGRLNHHHGQASLTRSDKLDVRLVDRVPDMAEASAMEELTRRRALSAFGTVAAGGLAGRASRTVPVNAAVRARAAARRPGTLLWQQRAGRGQAAAFGVDMTILAADAMVYAASASYFSHTAGTYAMDAATGRLAWREQGPLGYAAGAGAVFGIELTSRRRTGVVALSAATGRTAWTYDLGPPVVSTWGNWLAYDREMVYIAPGIPGIQPAVYALDARTGRRVWAASLTSTIQVPAVTDGVLYAVTYGRVIALHGATGAHLWESAYIGYEVSILSTADGVVCGNSVSDENSSLAFFALDGSTGRRLWQISSGASPTVAAAAGDLIFFVSGTMNPDGSTRSALSARSARSGKLAWTLALTGSPLAAAGGVLYFATTDSTTSGLVALAAATGDTMWSYPLANGITDVAADRDVVYVYDTMGYVYALQA